MRPTTRLIAMAALAVLVLAGVAQAGETFKQVLPEKKVQMIATEEGIGAVSLVCTHLGCIVQESDAGFSCPCHGSRFGPNGELRQGPAPRPLPWFAVSQAPDGALVVDRGREVDPGTFYQPIA